MISQIRSAGLPVLSYASATDAALYAAIGEISLSLTEVIFKVPTNPTYRWGNRIGFLNHNCIDDIKYCESLMDSIFGDYPEVTHYTFFWDVTDYQLFPERLWLEAGYEVDYSDTLLCHNTEIQAEVDGAAVSIRRLVDVADWDDALECQLKARSLSLTSREHSNYLALKFDSYRQLSVEGKLAWFGAYNSAQEQVANLGVFHCSDVYSESVLLRIQMVATHPEHQGKGVCTALLHGVLSDEFLRNGGSSGLQPKAVIVADPQYHAKSVYKRIGFREVEHQVIVTKKRLSDEWR
jgi:ribosomal protein S18 acetylase RimI-like enzyme